MAQSTNFHPIAPPYEDMWICNIFPFMGMGHYAFLGMVSKKFNRLYRKYCEQVKNPPYVFIPGSMNLQRRAMVSDTFYSNTFNSVCLASLWDIDQSPAKRPLHHLVCAAIANVGNLQVLSWAHFSRGYPWHHCSTAISAVRGGHLHVVQFLHKHRNEPVFCDISHYAAREGQLEILQYLIKDGCAFVENIWIYQAAACGHVHILEFLHSIGCSFPARTCADAAQNGHLAVLKWLRSIGCPWDETICSKAAYYGHLEILQWARAHDCPWNYDTYSSAISRNHLHIAKWAEDNGCPLPPT